MVEFDTLKQLYDRLRPALQTKKEQMHRDGFIYITDEDIWNYLKERKWLNASNLALYQMVSDILNTENERIDDYLKEKLNMKNRNVYFNVEDDNNDRT